MTLEQTGEVVYVFTGTMNEDGDPILGKEAISDEEEELADWLPAEPLPVC
jgi:hypothetical protein